MHNTVENLSISLEYIKSQNIHTYYAKKTKQLINTTLKAETNTPSTYPQAIR
eukprot:COSAG01_NODE_9_length_43729_cov_66.133463_39_plen_52_part_00